MGCAAAGAGEAPSSLLLSQTGGGAKRREGDGEGWGCGCQGHVLETEFVSSSREELLSLVLAGGVALPVTERASAALSSLYSHFYRE